jgi:hypothetical protein
MACLIRKCSNIWEIPYKEGQKLLQIEFVRNTGGRKLNKARWVIITTDRSANIVMRRVTRI